MIGRNFWQTLPDARPACRSSAVPGEAPQSHGEDRFSGAAGEWIDLHVYPSADGVSVSFATSPSARQPKPRCARARSVPRDGGDVPGILFASTPRVAAIT